MDRENTMNILAKNVVVCWSAIVMRPSLTSRHQWDKVQFHTDIFPETLGWNLIPLEWQMQPYFRKEGIGNLAFEFSMELSAQVKRYCLCVEHVICEIQHIRLGTKFLSISSLSYEFLPLGADCMNWWPQWAIRNKPNSEFHASGDKILGESTLKLSVSKKR